MAAVQGGCGRPSLTPNIFAGSHSTRDIGLVSVQTILESESGSLETRPRASELHSKLATNVISTGHKENSTRRGAALWEKRPGAATNTNVTTLAHQNPQ